MPDNTWGAPSKSGIRISSARTHQAIPYTSPAKKAVAERGAAGRRQNADRFHRCTENRGAREISPLRTF